MRFRMSDLAERSGLQPRTIRSYVKYGFIGPPDGHGPAASYDEEQMLRVVIIARMRDKRVGWDEIVAFLDSSSVATLRAYVEKTDPAPPSPSAPAPPDDPNEEPSPPRGLGGKAPRAGLPSRSSTAASDGSLEVDGDEGAPLEGGVGFVMVNVLPGLALMVRQDASPLVKRVAREMLRKYGAR